MTLVDPGEPGLGAPSQEALHVSRRRRRQRVSPDRAIDLTRERLVLGLLGASVIGSALAAGAVHVPVIVIACALALAAAVLALFLEPPATRAWSAPAAVLVGLALYTALQAIPLPRGLVQVLAPRNVASWDAAFDLLKLPRRAFLPISLDPRGSWVEALKWLTYAGAFSAAARVGHRLRSGLVPTLVFGSAVLAAIVALAHRLAGATTLFGVYRPIYVTSKIVLAPLLNLNNFAGYLNLGAFAGLGLLVAREAIIPRWLTALGVSVIVGTSVTSISRGGFLSLVLGSIALIVLLRMKRFGSGRQRLLVWLQVGALGLGITFFALSATKDSWAALVHESLEKFSLVAWTRRFITEHFFVGVGRGAFETAFPVYRADGGGHIYQYAENFVAQWCSEWGVPVGLAALGALFWLLRPSKLGTRQSASALTCVVGVGTLLLQNLVDLALEITSVALLAFVLLGGLFGSALRMKSQSLPRFLPLGGRFAPWLLAGAGVLLLATSAVLGVHTAERDRRLSSEALASLRKESPDEARAALEDVRQAILRHPGDPYLPLNAAIIARRIGENPLPWIGGALERDPMSGRAHLLLAFVMAGRGGNDQALLAIRMAAERDGNTDQAGARLAVVLTKDLDALRKLAPDGERGADMLMHLALAVSPSTDTTLRTTLLDDAIRRSPDNLKAHRLRLDGLLDALERSEEPCITAGGLECRKRVEALLARIQVIAPTSSLPLLARARLLLLDQKPEEMLRLLGERCPDLHEGSLECSRLRFMATLKLDNGERMDEAAMAYLSSACGSPASCERAAIWVGDHFGNKGLWGTALRMYERAARESGSPAAWKRVARAASRAGLVTLAQHALQRLKRSGESVDPKLAQDIERASRERMSTIALPPANSAH